MMSSAGGGMIESRRVLGLGDSSVVIHAAGVVGRRLLDRLFDGEDSAGVPPPRVRFEIREPDREGLLGLWRDDVLYWAGEAEGELAGRILDRTLFDIGDVCRAGPLLHAAAVVREGRAIVLAGPSGCGKTTLVAWLLSRGLDYQSDELVFVSPDGATVQAYPRPLMIKKESLDLLRARLDLPAHVEREGYVSRSARVLLLPARCLTRRPVVTTAKLGCVVFPRRVGHGPCELKPVSRALAAVRLMASLLNARNLPGHGAAIVARLARVLPVYELSYSDIGQVGGELERLIP